ncbi:hypothetical protein ILUMI_16707 [Ignelater luminosus]|uniref:Mutator-like transposase domain-containing protein n=1 Tax=Ignelater luminosus TaxID=2038154 RepID=A0A8K0CQS3_IGNLU|nr:hypothetical protein ILUMI_16707 [Ignelater luminosus]
MVPLKRYSRKLRRNKKSLFKQKQMQEKKEKEIVDMVRGILDTIVESIVDDDNAEKTENINPEAEEQDTNWTKPILSEEEYKQYISNLPNILIALLYTDVSKTSIFNNMQAAGEEERALAISNGNIDEDGVPYITVTVDGGWSKRSYGHSYTANSGVVSVAVEARKLLTKDVIEKLGTAVQKAIYVNADGDVTNLREDIRNSKARTDKRKGEEHKHVSRKKVKPSDNKDCGPNIAEVTMPACDLDNEITKIMKRLRIASKQIQLDLEQKTQGQYSNPRYVTEKMHHFTASNLGAVIRRRRILGRIYFTSPAIEYGLRNESVALQKFTEKTGKIVNQCALLVDLEHGFLGASPDGNI